MGKKTPEDDEVTGTEQDASAPKARRRKRRMTSLQVSPYLLRPLRTLEQATRESDGKDDEEEEN